MKELVKKHAQKLKFGIVGIANTALDFVLLFLFVNLGLDRIPANYISTGIAFVFSFFVNRSFTFNSKGGNVKKQFALFLIITMFGLWVLQPIVIAGVSAVLTPSGIADGLILFIAKLFATIVSLVWNYIMYSRFVFKKPAGETE
jgi:putative flippase GtrA